VLIRQNAPVIGASVNPYQQPGEWQVGVSSRTLTSDDHYRLDEEQVERHELGTYVVNKQRLYDIGVSWQATHRLNVSVGVPFIDSSWALPAPFAPPGPRVPQNGRGLGDITAVGRLWVLDPRAHTNGNVAVGVGMKLPTGADDVSGFYPDIGGTTWSLKAIDQSVQPGDGGWGVIVDASSFWRFKQAVVFGSGTYLANPKNTNDTPSIIVGLGRASDPANFDKLVNSVPDQYLVRFGAAAPIPKAKGISASLAFRAEGLRRYDLFGASNGFRRPGYELFVEPGIAFSRQGHSVTFNVPIGVYRMRKPDPNTGLRGDATFPDYILLGNYSFRFGKPRGVVAPAPKQIGGC
jgi:hypothetical protein